jgi:CRP-like cAMP-binding protein
MVEAFPSSVHQPLFKYIEAHSSSAITDAERELIKNAFVYRKFKKRQFLLEAGEVCKLSAFILRGAMRQYSVDEKGIEHIVRLSIENWWAADRESFIKETPSIYFIDAWEDTETLVTSKSDLDKLNNIPALGEMVRKLDENQAFAYQKRLNAAISLSAEQRYEDLAKTYPEFLQRFPQHIIASYLGITKETLSRIRSHAVKK